MPSWLTNSAVLVALAALLGKLLDYLFDGRHHSIKKSQEDIQRSLEILKGDNIEIKDNLNKNGQELAKVKRSSKDITRYRLYHDMKKEIMAGETTLEKKREMAKLFASYKMLDGNGEIEMMYEEEFIHLPLKGENK